MRIIRASKSMCAHEKVTFSFSVSPHVKESAIFPFIDRGHLRVLLRHRMPKKAHELFNLLFLSILSIEGIWMYEVSEYSRKHEQFYKSRTGFWKLCTLSKKMQTKNERNIFFKFINIFWIHHIFHRKHEQYSNLWTFFKKGTCVENS